MFSCVFTSFGRTAASAFASSIFFKTKLNVIQKVKPVTEITEQISENIAILICRVTVIWHRNLGSSDLPIFLCGSVLWWQCVVSLSHLNQLLFNNLFFLQWPHKSEHPKWSSTLKLKPDSSPKCSLPEPHPWWELALAVVLVSCPSRCLIERPERRLLLLPAECTLTRLGGATVIYWG